MGSMNSHIDLRTDFMVIDINNVGLVPIILEMGETMSRNSNEVQWEKVTILPLLCSCTLMQNFEVLMACL